MKFTFQHAIRFRTWGFIIVFLGVTYLSIFNEMIGTLILLAISFLCYAQYKCPYCNKKFDIRTSPDELEYCIRCGKKLNSFK